MKKYHDIVDTVITDKQNGGGLISICICPFLEIMVWNGQSGRQNEKMASPPSFGEKRGHNEK